MLACGRGEGVVSTASMRPNKPNDRLWIARGVIAACALCLWFPPLHGATAPKAKSQLDFNRDIRPIFSENCYACHGPDKNKRKAGLRFDRQEDALAKLEDGDFAIVPGDVAKSKLLKLIASSDEDDRMPPAKTGKRLTKAQIELLTRWIAEGAKWKPHWSYIVPERPAVPEVRNRNWPRNDIDRLILARLEQERLKPTREADKATLIRRLSFDLTGLPPKPEEVAAFEKDRSTKAYETLVDRLLGSPHYGERLAMHWLDLVRYADTDGFHADNYRSVWPYRDYVIKTFNDNLPFDRFTLEQIAGDLLPNATLDQKIASTYNRLHRTTEEGGAQAKEYLAKYAAERVRAVSGVWLAGTMGCAECHDHKYDPFSTKDFYSMEAFFADLKEVGVGKPEAVLLPNEQQAVELKSLDDTLASLQKRLDTQTPDLDAALAKWEKQLTEQPPPKLGPWQAIGPFIAESYEAAFKKEFEPEKEIDLGKAYQDGKLKWTEHPEWADGKVHNGLKGDNAATYLYRTITADTARPLALSLGSDDAIKAWLNGKEVLAHFISRSAAPDQEKITVQLQPGENKLLLKIVNGGGEYGFYFQIGGGAPENILTILNVASAQRTPEQQTELAKYFRSITPELDEARANLAANKKKRDELVAKLPTTLASIAVEPRVTRILPRGNWMRDDGEVVSPAVPHFLRQLETKEQRATRVEFAKWLVARDNPLTARVFVNRLWKLYFGAGLSRKLDDFGVQGEWPSHPELLDWLAVEFMGRGWDVKHMVKQMVMSSAYRQASSGFDQQLIARDPDNRLLARQARFRLEGELVRDNALAVSGLLADRIGGPSVKPYQPAGYWDHLNFPKRMWEHDKGEAIYRRGLYTFWCRTFLQPGLMTFDVPSREECTADRVRSNTPLQALVLLDDPTYVEAARVFAEKIVREGGQGVGDRIHWSFARAVNRKPDRKEQRILEELFRKQLDRYKADKESAEKLVSAGEWPVAKDLDAAELAAWTSVSRAVLNLHETITRN
ncbi:MAG: PSD1 domain-containing protein [Verrucomicrobia bacterium]|nr:PSD1 domain-containing protein [Verrucomicrobiota bacterium]